MNLDQAQRLAARIKNCGEFELHAPIHLSAVCFRHLVQQNASEDERNRFNLALLKKLVSRGRIYLSNAELKGKFYLRACVVNHLTTDDDIDAVVPEVLTAASELLST
jgi:aromatic-L-amino-acid/L-tryptophan decarboxylase